jgi:tetratricopeptide (TPR) repeat protein
VRATSSLGEVANEMIRTQEEKVRALKIDGERRFAAIAQLPRDTARVQEVAFYREQAKHWMAMGEYQEAHNCLEKGIRRSEEARLELFRIESQRLLEASRKKLDQEAALDKKIREMKKRRLAQILLIGDREERNYQLLKLFYETGKMYFVEGQYKKAVQEWELGLELIRDYYIYQ